MATRDAIDIRGSDSEVSLVERLAEAFMAEQPQVAISVTGGGSGVGIAALLDGTIDLCTSSRELEPIERLLALRKQVELHITVFATDALSIVVHADNPIAALDLDTLGRIYRGELTRWPGSARAIVCYGRQSSSGTYAFFEHAVVRGDHADTVRQLAGNAHVLDAVARDVDGIGYVAVGMLAAAGDSLRAVPILDAEGSAISPLDREAVLSGRYPIARPLLQLTRGPARGRVREFLRFELSAGGQAIVESMGFYPVAYAWRERNRHLGDIA
jgi:phosphate transport system substrate-binding protein